MKGFRYPRHWRKAAPVLLLALSACNSTPPASQPPLLVDSELGIPLGNTQRSGDALLDRQRAQALSEQKPLVRHQIDLTSRAREPRSSTPTRNPLGDQPVTLNFVEADIQAVVRALSRSTGLQFLVDPRVKGNLTLVSEGQVPAHQAYDMLLAALRMQGFSVVDVGGVAQVVPEADAKLLGGPIYSADKPAGNGMLTRTFRLQYENAVNLIPVLRPIVSPNNPINAYPGNNTIVITDYADNLARVAQLIEGIDTPSAIDTDVVSIQNGIAVDIAQMVSELLETQGGDQTQKINVIGDPRSNSIIIRAGSPERTELARNLIYKLDNAQNNPSNLHVVYLRNAQAGKLAQSLRGLLTGESEGESSDNSRSVLSGMGSSTNNQSGQSSANSTSSTTSGSTSTSGNGSAQGSSWHASASTKNEQNTAFSAGGVTIQADATTNTLLISAPDPLYRNLREVIDMLDQRRAQVVIESLIVEVGEDDASEFGVQWQSGNLGGSGVIGGVNLGGSGLNLNGKTSIDVLPQGLNLGVVNGTVDIPGIGKILDLKVLARALKSKGGTNVLSTPNLLTLDNEAASIFVGQTIPFVSGSYVTSGNSSDNPFQTVTREEVGLKLNVRPQISEGGTVKLDIYQEVSSVDDRASSTTGIVTNKRAIDTSILLDDGQIMVLGGLLQDSYSQSNDAVPWLSTIPGIGALFRNERRQITKTNLMVFLRPYIIRDTAAGRGITLNRYDFMRRAQGQLQPEHSWAMPDMQAPQLPASAKAIPVAVPAGLQTPRAVIKAVPVTEPVGQ